MNRQQKLLIVLAVAGALFMLSKTSRGESMLAQWIDKLAAFLTGEEGERLTVYQDQAGLWTIGKGHLVKPGEPYHPYGPIRTITPEESQRLFERDTLEARSAVQGGVTIPLTDNQRVALTSLVFNIGAAAFRGSTLLRLLNKGDITGAADQFLVWNKITDPKSGAKLVSNGLAKRRTRERSLFLS